MKTNCRPIASARSTRRRTGGIPRACRTCCARSRGSTRPRRTSAACRTICRRIRSRPIACSGSTARSPRFAQARATRRSRRIVPAICGASMAWCSARTRAKASCAATSSCIRTCASRCASPHGWEIQNGKTQVVAKAPGAQLYMLLDLVQQPQGANLQDIALNDMNRAGFRALQGGDTHHQRPARLRRHVPGIDAEPRRGRRARRLRAASAARCSGSRASRRPTPSARGRGVFGERAHVPRADRARSGQHPAEPDRSLHGARRRDVAVDRAGRRAAATSRPSTLAIINNFPPNEQPRPGDRIKIVVARSVIERP